MPNSIKVSRDPGNKVTYTKRTGGEQWLMIFLAIVLAGIATIWLTCQWYAYQDQETKHRLWQSWQELSNRLSMLAKSQNTRLAITPANNEIDFLSPNSIATTNIKVWQQTMKAIDDLNKQTAIAGSQPSYHNRLGILYAQAGDFAAALKQFNQAIVLCRKQIGEKSSQTTSCDLSNLYVELTCAHSNLARIYDRLGAHDRVIAELEELNADITFAGDTPSRHPVIQKTVLVSQVNRPPNNNDLTPEETALFAKAEALRQVGQLPQAMQAYTDLINKHPNFALAHQRLGLAATAANDLGLAMNELLIAVTLDSKDPDTYNDLGLVYRQLGDYSAAKQAFAQAHRVDPKHLSASMNYADSLATTGSLPSALHVMQQATAYHSDSPAAHNDLAALYARTGNDKAAAKEFAQTLSLNSGLASAHYGLGLASLNLKSYPQAINELETAQKLNPGILDLQNRLDLANRCNSKELASAQGIGY